MKIFTWHVHGSYLYYLSQGNYDLYIPVNKDKTAGYGGRGTIFPFGENVIEIPTEEVVNYDFDIILFQSKENYLNDQYTTLSIEQRRDTPKIFLEHDPPRESPTNTIHVVQDPEIPVVHVTHFNRLMWHCKTENTYVIEHGLPQPQAAYKGDINKGIVVINDLESRGRRLGLEVFLKLREEIPLDLIGMNSKKIGGIGEVQHPDIPKFISRYRFFLNSIRYTSLGLSVCEAMMIGMPVVGLATTEMVTTIKDGETGFLDNRLSALIDKMKLLMENQEMAKSMGLKAQQYARKQFDINRFVNDWETLFEKIAEPEVQV